MFETSTADPSGRSGGEADSISRLLDVGGLRGDARSQRLRDIERHQSRVDAARLALLQVWDADVQWATDGSSSGAAWLAPRLGISGHQARERIKVARWLRHGELVGDSLEAGRLTWAKVALFARFVTDGCLERFEQDEQWLVSTCERLRVEHCARFLRYWASHADPDAADADDDARWEHRSLVVAECWDGMGDVRANLTPEALLCFRQLLDRVIQELYRDEDPNDPAHVERTPAQRRHDAFVEIIRRAAAWDAQNATTAKPSLVAFLDHEATRTRAADQARRAARDEQRWAAEWERRKAEAAVEPAVPEPEPPSPVGGGTDDDDHDDDGAAPECSGSALASGWHGPVITRKDAHRWLCEADVCRLLLGPDGEVLDLGRTARLYSGAQRKAIIARQGGECVWPDCDRPAGWLQVHHLDEWDRDRGGTDLDRGVAACVFHHHRIHDAGFSIRGDPATGALTFHRPDGTQIE